MAKGKWSKIAWCIIALCFVILVFVGQGKIKEQNQVSSIIVPRSDIQKNTESDIAYSEKEALEGKIYHIAGDQLFMIDFDGVTHEIDANGLINARTRDNIDISNIAINDYYKNGEIIRNISGDELRQELLLNLARAFNSSKLSTELIRLKRLKVYDDYVTFKVSFYDGNYELFGRENPELFHIQLLANEDTVLYARTDIVNIYNLQKSVRDKVFFLGIDENTLFDERPLVTEFEIAE